MYWRGHILSGVELRPSGPTGHSPPTSMVPSTVTLGGCVYLGSEWYGHKEKGFPRQACFITWDEVDTTKGVKQEDTGHVA